MREKGLAILFHNAGLASNHEGNRKAALRYFQRALEVSPDREITLALLCQVYLEKGLLGKAHSELQGRIRDVEKIRSPKLLEICARVMYSSGRVKKAMAFARSALQKDPGHLEALLILAQSFKTLGNRARAEWYWHRYLEKRPDSVKARLALLELYAGTGKEVKSLEIAKDLLCISRTRDFCGVVARGNDKENLYTIYKPDMKVIKEAVKNALSEKAAQFLNCSGGHQALIK